MAAASLSAISLFGAIMLLAVWWMRDPDVIGARMRRLAARDQQDAAEEPFSERVLMPASRALMRRLTNVLPAALIGRTRGWLLAADSEMQVSVVFTIAVVSALIYPVALIVLMVALMGRVPGGVALLAVPLGGLLGFAFPLMVLRSRAAQRQEQILKLLPDTLDLLTACVEAGLSLDYAFQRVVERQHGPVSDELNRMLREKALGQTRREALTAMAERIDLPDVNVFVQSVVQAETQGTSIASVLRTQSRQLRIRRRQKAEEMAAKAGPKMVFPLVFFVLPSLFIVILGPVAIDVWGNFKGF